MAKTGIIVIDDHQLLREGLAMLLANDADFELVAEAGDGRTGIQLVTEHHPDVVILDVGMPQMNGVEACRQIKKRAPDVRVLALSMHSSYRIVKEMLKAGASGYVLKSAGFEEILTALKIIGSGHRYLSPEIVDAVVDEALNESSDAESNLFSTLSSREREIAQLLTEGKTAKEIAYTLNVTVRTVDAHKKNILEKISVSNVAELTRVAIREGIIDSHLQAF